MPFIRKMFLIILIFITSITFTQNITALENKDRFPISDFKLQEILEETRREIEHIVKEMDKSIEITKERINEAGIKSSKTLEILQELYEMNPYAYDCAIINDKGIIIQVAPEKEKAIIGADISKQEQVIRLHESKKPVFSLAIDTVEGFISFDLEHPLVDRNGKLTGSVSILTKPDFFESIISRKAANLPVDMWMIQKDGRIIYDINPKEIGRNLFTDPLYAKYESLLKTIRRVVESPQGQGEYMFLDHSTKKTVEKSVVWTTINLHGTEFRLALSYAKP